MPGDKLVATVDFFGMMQMPNVTYLGFANNHSSITAVSWLHTCARWDHGAGDLRRQRR